MLKIMIWTVPAHGFDWYALSAGVAYISVAPMAIKDFEYVCLTAWQPSRQSIRSNDRKLL